MSNDTITISRKALNAIVATALDTALAAVLDTETPASATPTIADRNVKTNTKRVKNSRKRQSSATKTAPAPKVTAKHYDATVKPNSDGFVTGLLAAHGTKYQLVDKSVNVKTQCNVRGCKVLRKGRARFCRTHQAENRNNVFASNGVTLDEVERDNGLS